MNGKLRVIFQDGISMRWKFLYIKNRILQDVDWERPLTPESGCQSGQANNKGN
jgi:hypothetical protein